MRRLNPLPSRPPMRRTDGASPACAAVVLCLFAAAQTAPAQSILVSNTTAGRIDQYTWPSGSFIRTFVPAGPSAAPPMGIRFGPDGNLFAAGYDADCVMEYDGVTGAAIGALVAPGTPASFNQPVGLIFTPPSIPPAFQRLFVTAQVGSPSGSCAFAYSPSGSYVATYPCAGEQWYPLFGEAVPWGATGAVYISWNNWAFPPKGRVVRHAITDGTPLQYYEGTIVGPVTGVAVMPDGSLLVADYGADRVWRFDTSTSQTFAPSLGSFLGGGAYLLDGPRDIVFGPNGNLFVVGGLSNNVLEFNGATGAFVRTVLSGLNGPWGLAFGYTPGDLDGDDDVDQADLGILLAAYGATAAGDLDGDGDTDQADLGILLAGFGG